MKIKPEDAPFYALFAMLLGMAAGILVVGTMQFGLPWLIVAVGFTGSLALFFVALCKLGGPK